MSTTETKVRHTPGPWFVERAGRNPRVLAKPKGFRSTPENPVFVVTNNVYISADKDEATANAHVIAAAPDMLEALEDAPPCPGTPGHFPTNPRDCYDWFTRYWNWQQKRADAIAKAKGGAA